MELETKFVSSSTAPMRDHDEHEGGQSLDHWSEHLLDPQNDAELFHVDNGAEQTDGTDHHAALPCDGLGRLVEVHERLAVDGNYTEHADAEQYGDSGAEAGDEVTHACEERDAGETLEQILADPEEDNNKEHDARELFLLAHGRDGGAQSVDVEVNELGKRRSCRSWP